MEVRPQSAVTEVDVETSMACPFPGGQVYIGVYRSDISDGTGYSYLSPILAASDCNPDLVDAWKDYQAVALFETTSQRYLDCAYIRNI